MELGLSGPEWFSLGGRSGGDPLVLVLGQLAGLDTGERALVQILARPVTVRAQQRLVTVARQLRSGIPTSRIGRLLDLVLPGSPTPRPTLDPALSPDVRNVLEKASHPLYRCTVRIAVDAPSRGVARGRIHAIAGAFAAYEDRVGFRRRRVRHAQAKMASRALGRGFLLSVPELAALAHLPAHTSLPGLVRAGARSVAPSPAVPSDGKPLGLTDSGQRRPVAVGVADARQHVHLMGATGAGKSTALAQMVLADAQAGRGAIVIDPKGDLVDDILARVADPAGPLVVIDPERSQRPAGLNVLQAYDRDLAAEYLVGTFRRMFEQFWGPRTDDILRACVLTLARDPRLTLAEIPTCLANPAWRQRLTQGLAREDPVLAGFWHWYDELSEANQVQAVGPLLNKLRAFLLRRPVRAIVGQSQTTF
ncbi:MAG: type IV secretion system DNA-binding domain-containing protein, partial [Trebonia sp.]